MSLEKLKEALVPGTRLVYLDHSHRIMVGQELEVTNVENAVFRHNALAVHNYFTFPAEEDMEFDGTTLWVVQEVRFKLQIKKPKGHV